MIHPVIRYICLKSPGPFGVYLRRHFYGKYFHHQEFVIRDNVFMEGYKNNISLGKNVTINPNVSIFSSEGKLTIGNNVFINWNCFLSSDRSEMVIGDNSLLANNVTIWCSNHDYRDREKLIRQQDRLMKPVKIGRDVWIGAQATILPGAIIGDGCVVGAGSVVTKDFPPYTVLAGVPARAIKKRGVE